MKIEPREISIRDIVNGYIDNNEEGIVAYGGKLNIRPAYQREFVYNGKQRVAVVNTVRKNFPLNVMYWAVNDDGTYEVLDGQQRTISICQYITNEFARNNQFFRNLMDEEQDQILDYKVMVYFCDGGAKEKLEWFKTINIAGEKLTNQELRNATYTGQWLSDAKGYFSKTGCVAFKLAHDYMRGTPIRQDYLETAIDWVGGKGNAIEEYMAIHQRKPNANDMWLHFQSAITWFKTVFPNYRKEMKGLPIGFMYDDFKNVEFDTQVLEQEISDLMMDDDVTKKSGIYQYVLTRDEKYLNVRSFTPNQKREAYERQEGVCAHCGDEFELEDMEADHITPWSEGGKTNSDNCQMLCKHDNRVKSNK